jgi:hypothetical protein
MNETLTHRGPTAMQVGDWVRTRGKPLPKLLQRRTGQVVEVPRADYCRVRLDTTGSVYSFANWELDVLALAWQQGALFGGE